MAAVSFSLARVYQHSFRAYPYSTLAVTGACLATIGDASAQFIQDSALTSDDDKDRRPYDVARTARFLCYGFMLGPVMGRWNWFLEQRFPLHQGQRNTLWKNISKRLLLDQTVMAPFLSGLFLTSMGAMEGRSLQQMHEKVVDLYPTVLTTNWKFWPAVQLVNFWVIPLVYRVPFSQTCGVFWTVYLSMMNARENKHIDAPTTGAIA